MNNERVRYSTRPPGWFRLPRIFVSVAMIAGLMNVGSAQDFIVNGTMTNTGTIRVKNQTTIAQSAVGGEIELKGGDQPLPAKQYEFVRLSGTGTKTTLGGNFSITKNLTIASPVTLNIAKGTVITLGDTLFESGILNGAVQKTVTLSGGTTSSEFGKIGATINWSGSAPGVTTVIRSSDSTQFGNGNQSIRRFYDIQTANAAATGTVVLKFNSAELNGHDIAHLQLWQSGDNGVHWVRRIPIVDTVLKTITRSNVALAGRWTAADTVRALGPLNSGAGVPFAMADMSLQNVSQPILALLNPFKVVITDAFGTPVQNVTVKFAITGKPPLSSGEVLSDTTVTTDTLGAASSIFTLGDKVGAYQVTATSGSLTPIVFSVNAKHGQAHSLAKVAVSPQTKVILTQLDTAFTIIVSDVGGNLVDSANVQFALSAAPSGATGQGLSVANALTDSLGRASTYLTLGKKVGTYSVNAAVTGVAGFATFSGIARAGSPAAINALAGNNQSGINGQQLSTPFVVSVADIGGNPVSGDTAVFAIQTAPNYGAVLSTSSSVTDSTGSASTMLTLGKKTGDYIVTARSQSLGGTLLFTSKALPGAPSTMNIVSGNDQTIPVNSILESDFVVRIFDVNGNLVPNARVKFTIGTSPSKAAGASLSVVDTLTDSLGTALTRLTLGNKLGTYTVNADVNGVPTVVFVSKAAPGAAASFAAFSGNGQSTEILTSLQSNFALHVLDAGGNAVPNAVVNFTIDSSPSNAFGQRLTVSSMRTDSTGSARTSLILGNKVGTYTVRAACGSISEAAFTARATNGAATSMAATAGLHQSKQILTALDVPFAVHVTDIGDNNVPGSHVQFSVTNSPAGAAGAKVNISDASTDSLGFASALLTLGDKVGDYEVTALITVQGGTETQSVIGKKNNSDPSPKQFIEVKFTANALHGTAALMAQGIGNKQTQPTGTTLDTAYTLTVKDIGGNIVPGTPVHFGVLSAPQNAAGQTLRDTLVVTDSSGVASTYFTLGDREGSYTVSASVHGVNDVMFTANAYYVYGDPNGDNRVDIADITTLIDQIIGMKQLSIADSIKADLNKDGKINLADITLLVDSVLSRPLVVSSIPGFLLHKTSANNLTPSGSKSGSSAYFAGASTQLESTPDGLRLNVTNTVPVRGIELRIHLKDSTIDVSSINYLFSRAKEMNVVVKTIDHEIRLLAYNLLNTEIQPGDGPVFRIPKITSLAQIETTQVIISDRSNTSAVPEITVAAAPAGKYPQSYKLEQNFPNPFNGSTTIRYEIPDKKVSGTRISIQVFNILGQKVKTLVSAQHDPGQYSVTWDGNDDGGVHVSSGIYFYRMITKDGVSSKKMIYVK